MSRAPVRAHFADELRGFALLGIVLVNAPFLAISSNGYTAASVSAPIDRLAALCVVAFAQAKFYLIFSFLFGYGLSFLLDRNDRAQRIRYGRRLLGLALLGSVHAVTAFVGDILLLYAVIGIVMLVAVRWSDRTLLRFSAGVGVAWLLMLALVAWSANAPDVASGGFGGESLDLALKEASFIDAARARLTAWPGALALIGVLNGLAILALFALGLFSGRRGVLAHPERYNAVWKSGLALGASVGLPLAMASAWMSLGPGADVASGSGAELVGVVIGFAGAPFLSWGYLSALAKLHCAWPAVMRIFRPAGRMSLTGYLGESILLSLIFCGYGLGMHGEFGAAATALVAAVVWLILDVFSRLWLNVFPRGPFEMLLRRITH